MNHWAGDAVKWRRGVVAALLALVCACLLAPLPALAAGNITRANIKDLFPETKQKDPLAKEAPSSKEPVTVEADAMGYDKEHAIVVAIGHVIITQGDYLLNADKVTYFQDTDKMIATGHVSVLQPTGTVYFADSAELSDAMKHGVLQAFKGRLADNSVVVASSAHKINAAVTEMDHAVYSPCKLCENLAPFWQIKSSSMNVDEQQEEITYHNAQLEMFGIPTFYTPYLQGPTPNAEAKSGILTPTYGSSTTLGTNIKLPYYWRIADDKDATITPWFFTKDNPMLMVDYRELTDHGKYSIIVSGTDPQKIDSNGNAVGGDQFRGHINAQGEEGITDYSRVGFDINRASDQTYLRRYALGGDENGVLFSSVYANVAEQRNFASIQGLEIQGLRVGDSASTTPQVLPTIDGYYEGTPMDSGLRFHIAGDAQNLQRDVGADQRRLSVNTGATLPYITDNGQLINASATVRQDLYDVDNVPLANGTNFDGSKARTIPQGALQWRYPLVRAGEGGSMTIEPLVLGVVQPTGENPPQIDNEDSKQMELNDTNLFDIDRVPGYDVIDSGSRLAYGFRTEYMVDGNEAIDGLLGQNYSFDSSTPFPNSTKPGTNASDIIGRLGFTINPFSIAYRFAIGESDLNLNRSSVTFNMAEPWLIWSLTYNSVKDNRYLPNSEEVSSTASMPIADEWKIYASAVRDLQLDQMTNAGAGLIYHNECFDFTLDGLRNYTHDRDVPSSTSVTFRVGFKNLGVFGG